MIYTVQFTNVYKLTCIDDIDLRQQFKAGKLENLHGPLQRIVKVTNQQTKREFRIETPEIPRMELKMGDPRWVKSNIKFQGHDNPKV